MMIVVARSPGEKKPAKRVLAGRGEPEQCSGGVGGLDLRGRLAALQFPASLKQVRSKLRVIHRIPEILG